MNEDTHFLQPKILGYRQLSPEEAALINEGKELAEQCREYISKISDLHSHGTAIDLRWLSVGTTHLQQGFMAIIRSIARPTTF